MIWIMDLVLEIIKDKVVKVYIWDYLKVKVWKVELLGGVKKFEFFLNMEIVVVFCCYFVWNNFSWSGLCMIV